MKTLIILYGGIERLNNSVNGNPRYRIRFSDGITAITSSDHAFAYKIGNPGFREGDTVQVEFTRAGRICDMKAPPDRTELTDLDKTAIYQLEKVDQGGEVMDLFENQIWAVADGMGLEVDDDEESPGFMHLKLGEDRWATLTMQAVVFDSQGDTQAKVFIATHYSEYLDYDPLEVDPAENHVGVYSSEDSAWQAVAEAAAERLAEYEGDGEGIDQAIEYMSTEYWDVAERPVLD